MAFRFYYLNNLCWLRIAPVSFNIGEWRSNCIKIDYRSFDSALFLCKLCVDRKREMFLAHEKNVIGFFDRAKVIYGRLVTTLECLFLSPSNVINSIFFLHHISYCLTRFWYRPKLFLQIFWYYVWFSLRVNIVLEIVCYPLSVDGAIMGFGWKLWQFFMLFFIEWRYIEFECFANARRLIQRFFPNECHSFHLHTTLFP